VRKIIGFLLGLAVLAFCIESMEPGLTNMICEDHAAFLNDVIIGAGDTLWTEWYGFYTGGFEGIFCVSFNVDTVSAGSCKVQLILREGNDIGDWMLQDTVLTVNHALKDWDTCVEFDPLPTMFFQLGFLDCNGTNDSVRISDVKVFSIKD
jgi:hypothetical protein